MQQLRDNSVAVQQVGSAVSNLTGLSVLPGTAVRYLAKFTQNDFDRDSLIHIIESDPALTAFILSSAPEPDFSIAAIVNRTAPAQFRRKLLSAKVLPLFAAQDEERLFLRSQLTLHSIACAVCAKELASSFSPQIDPQLAFSAGLLHDIGKFGLDEVMPKSFQRLTATAGAQNQSFYSIEQTYLGLDHTILGKHLAEKWQLPPEIITVIWLHHSPAEIMLTNIPHIEIAMLVNLANLIAHNCNIGQSGSFDKPADINKIAARLSISPEQIRQLSDELPNKVAQITDASALAKTTSAAQYCQLLSDVLAHLNNSPEITTNQHRQLTEQLVSILTHTSDAQGSLVAAETMANLAELAAGAAHELNNPLAVIAGRSQLLSNSETDQSKKETLELIFQKAQVAADIAGELMNFARPAQPQSETVSPLVLLNNAFKLTTDKGEIEHIPAQLENIDNLKDAYVDIEQMAEALSNIISNALESYDQGSGQLKIVGAFIPDSNQVRFDIIDSGCGMSSEVLQKASLPFYSAAPAGRKRGMGLAIAYRLIRLNNGCITIASAPQKGTTVTVLLPCVNESENLSE